MNPPTFLVSAALIAALALAHSALGERFILRRLMRRDLPPLFGDDVFTKVTLRFAWHALTIAWWGMAALLVWMPVEGHAALGWTVASTLLATSVLTIIISRGRHLSWVVELVVVALLLVELA